MNRDYVYPKTLDFGLLVLRVGAAALMMTHGWGKVQMLLGGNAENFGDPIGLGPEVSLFLAAGAEFVCALLVLLGVYTRITAIPVAFTMLVAAFVVHAADPLGTKEMALLYAIVFIALIFTGGGRFSLDSLWRRRGRR